MNNGYSKKIGVPLEININKLNKDAIRDFWMASPLLLTNSRKHKTVSDYLKQKNERIKNYDPHSLRKRT